MPHLGSHLIDSKGLALVHDWIHQMPPDMEVAEKIEELASLDEPAILQKEQQDAALTRWKIARQIANRDDREIPTQADMDAAVAQAKNEAKTRATQRKERRQELIGLLLKESKTALALARAYREGKLPASIQTLSVSAAMQHEDLAVRDLFDPFLPDDQRIVRLGDSIDSKQLLSLAGDANRGRELFLTEKGVSCRNCHRVGQTGKSVGPDLSQIGKKLNRAKLLESLLEPSREIDPKFASWQVLTKSGQVVVGLLEKRTNREVVLRDAEGKEHQLATDDIEQMFPQRTSLMPDRQLRDLTAQQAADLLEWLASLK